MNIKILQAENSIENVDRSVVSALYNAHINGDISLEVDENNQKVGLVGSITAPAGYAILVSTLNSAYPKFHVSVNSEYMSFADSTIELTLLNAGIGDGTGITLLLALSVYSWPKISNLTFIEETGVAESYSIFNEGNFAFYKSSHITTFDELGLFTNLKTLPYGIFWGSTLSSINLSNITSMRPAVFTSCSSLPLIINMPKLNTFLSRNINHTGYNTEGLLFSHTNITEINIGSEVLEGLKISKVSLGCFLRCTLLLTITGLSEITTIELDSFRNCTNLQNLLDLNLNISTIGKEAFRDSGLLCIDIRNVTTLSDMCFFNCTNLMALDTNDTLNITQNSEYTVNATNIGNTAFSRTKLTGKTINLPNVTTLNSAVFEYSTLSGINIPNVTRFMQYCFSNCTQLSINALKLLNAVSIERYAFLNVNLSGEINCPNLQTLGLESVFRNTHITSVKNLGSITTLKGYGVFGDCPSLLELILPTSLVEFSFNVLEPFSSSTTTTNVTELIFPYGVTTIEGVPFLNYGKIINYLLLPATLTTWNLKKMFYFTAQADINLTVVVLATTPPSTGYTANGNSFMDGNYLGYPERAKWYVPDDKLTVYLSDPDWAPFASRIFPISQLETDSPTNWSKYQSNKDYGVPNNN